MSVVHWDVGLLSGAKVRVEARSGLGYSQG